MKKKYAITKPFNNSVLIKKEYEYTFVSNPIDYYHFDHVMR